MAVMKGLEWTFDTVASTYEKFRPGYVTELYQKLFQYRSIDESSRVLEVGIGGGQATLPIGSSLMKSSKRSSGTAARCIFTM